MANENEKQTQEQRDEQPTEPGGSKQSQAQELDRGDTVDADPDEDPDHEETEMPASERKDIRPGVGNMADDPEEPERGAPELPDDEDRGKEPGGKGEE